MALFGSQKKTSDAGAASTETYKPRGRPAEQILLRPRITEKAVLGNQDGVYVFEVYPDVGKSEIAKAVRHVYNVAPRKVNIAPIPKKQTFQRRRRGVKGGGKKAYVYLKKGDKIDLV